jgi:hypothetical protein
MWLEQDIAAGNGSVLEFHRKNYGENFEYPGNRKTLKIRLTCQICVLNTLHRFCTNVSSRVV